MDTGCGEIHNLDRGWGCKKENDCIQSALGPVISFIQRYMIANPDGSWAQLKTQLAFRFSDVQMALSLLRTVKQKEILSLAEEAYHNQSGDIVERQLIYIFVDGLTNDGFKMKILRDQPNTLQGAIAIFTNEQNLTWFKCHTQNSTHKQHQAIHPWKLTIQGVNGLEVDLTG